MFKTNSVYPVLLEIQKLNPGITYTEYLLGENYKIFQLNCNSITKSVKIYTNIQTGDVIYFTKNNIHSKEPLPNDEIYLFKDNVQNIIL